MSEQVSEGEEEEVDVVGRYFSIEEVVVGNRLPRSGRHVEARCRT